MTKEVNYFSRQETADILGMSYLNKKIVDLFHDISSKYKSSQVNEKVKIQEGLEATFVFSNNIKISAEQTIKLGQEEIRVREITYPKGRSYIGIDKDDIEKVAKYLGREIDSVPEQAKSEGIHKEKRAFAEKQAHKIPKFRYQQNDDTIHIDESREYVNWIRNNMKEMGMESLGDLAKASGMSTSDIKAIVYGKFVTGKEDTKLNDTFKSLNHDSPQDIIRDYRNERMGKNYSRCSNASLSAYTGIPFTRIESITNGLTPPSESEINILTKKLGISEKDQSKLRNGAKSNNSRTTAPSPDMEGAKMANKIDELIAKFSKTGPTVPSRNK